MKVFEEVKFKIQKHKNAVVTGIVTTMVCASASVACFAEDGTTDTIDIGTTLSGISDKLLDSFTQIIMSCLDLAVSMVPIALAFIGAIMVINKGKQMIKKI